MQLAALVNICFGDACLQSAQQAFSLLGQAADIWSTLLMIMSQSWLHMLAVFEMQVHHDLGARQCHSIWLA